jgi:transcriptional regulator with XRE-family HTH domain
MQSIGERLEEARKRRGISVREASEATKIRGDFLLNFENNQFDVGLPDIYVRGFLRNYSSFLKIDPEKIVTDFNATLLGETKSGRRDARELFGRMELPERPRPIVEGNTPASPTAPRRRVEEPPELQGRGGGGGNRGNPDYSNYMKIGLIIVAGVASVLVIVWLVMMIINAAQGPASTSTTPPERTPANVSTAPEDTFVLVALGDVSVRVTQTSDNALLFDGLLARGERKPITRRGPVVVVYNPGINLQVELKGKLHRMTGGDGIGRSTIP